MFHEKTEEDDADEDESNVQTNHYIHGELTTSDEEMSSKMDENNMSG
jgi:hypothetical protein